MNGRITWWQLGMTALGVYMLVAGLRGMGEWMRARQRLTDASAELERVRLENEKLKLEWEKVSDPKHVEEIARDELRMQLPGETVVMIRQPESEGEPEAAGKGKSATEGRNWEKWARLMRFL